MRNIFQTLLLAVAQAAVETTTFTKVELEDGSIAKFISLDSDTSSCLYMDDGSLIGVDKVKIDPLKMTLSLDDMTYSMFDEKCKNRATLDLSGTLFKF